MNEQEVKRIYRPDLEGKRVYPIWRVDKNISWFNVSTYPMGIIFGIMTLEWLTKKGMMWRFKRGGFWLPPIYAKGFYREEERTNE